MVAPTQVRAGRAVRLYAGFQSAKGTAVTNFAAAGVVGLRSARSRIWAGPESVLGTFADADLLPAATARWKRPDKPAERIRLLASPAATDLLLKSNYGPRSLGVYQLQTQVETDRWLTLGWIEDRYDGSSSTERLIRIRDAWFHRLSFLADAAGGHKGVWVEADYAGRAVLIQAQDAGGVTFPSTPMANLEKGNVFSAPKTTLVRDPSGANVTYRWRRLRVTLDQRLGHEWDAAAFAYDVFKMGKLRAELEFEGEFSDETWTLLDQARAGTAASWRVQMTSDAASPGILTFTLHNVVLEIDPSGHDGTRYSAFRARGIAAISGANSITITG